MVKETTSVRVLLIAQATPTDLGPLDVGNATWQPIDPSEITGGNKA